MQKTSKDLALIIDANSLIHRAWHALPPLTAPDGRLVNAVYGFTSVLLKVVAELRPTYLAVCWDTPEPTYRHKAREEYKAQREKQPDEFYAQFPFVHDVVESLGGTNIAIPGFEADDILATLSKRFADTGVDAMMLTSDKDVWQLLAPHVKVMMFKKGVSDVMVLDADGMKELTGLTPSQWVDYKALRGDPSDNLKGIPGVGEKTATELLVKFGDLDGIFTAAKDTKSDISKSLREKLLAGESEARSLQPIVALVMNADIGVSLDALKRRAVDESVLRETFQQFGFKTLLARALGGKKDGESVETQTIAHAAETTSGRGAKNQMTRVTLTTLDALTAFMDEVRKQGELIIHPLEVAQGSLFVDVPVLVMGTHETDALLTSSVLQKKEATRVCRELMNDASIKKIGHNLKSAWHWSTRVLGVSLEGMAFDTEIASYLAAGGEGEEDLATLAATHLEMTIQDGDHRPFEEVDAIRGLVSVIQPVLNEQGLGAFMQRFETPLISILAQMEETGVLIDRAYFAGITEDFRSEKKRLEREMEALAGEPFNPGSPQQLGHVLFDVLNISSKGIKRGKTGISTAASELEKLEGTHPIIEKISEYREVAKLLSTYVEALPALADSQGRVHTTFNQALTSTGRLSSSNPNLQNIPIRTELGRKIRRGFTATPGYTLLSCDYSQIELRVVAALAHDEKMLDAFARGVDIHTATAASIWKVALDEVTKEQRRAAKAINFGILYGQGPVGLSKAAGISFDEAKQFIAKYFEVYAGVKEFMDATKALAHERGYVETLFGRRRVISDINSPLPQLRAAAERMAINMPVQGTATADLMKLAMIELAKQLPKISADTRMVLQVHDELVFEVPSDDVDCVAAAVKEIMEHVEDIGVPIVAEARAGKNWGEVQPLE